jgi:flavin-dependent dehydrogenase
MNLNAEYDIVVVGAGVAGLSAGTASARSGARTLVIDAAPEVAMKTKGEIIRSDNTIVENILEKPLPAHIINGKTKHRRIYSPSSKNHMVLESSYESLMIEYRPFLYEIARACIGAGASLALNTIAGELILNDEEEVCGLNCRSGGEHFSLHCKAVIGADGHSSRLREQASLPSPATCTAYKVVIEGGNIPDTDVLEFFLLNNPSGALWIFPKGGNCAECGITLWDQSPEAQKTNLQALWEQHRMNHPLLSERLAGASYVLTSFDKLIFGGVLEEFVRPGLVLVGDAAGQVGARGSSGILSGMNMGYTAGEFLGACTAAENAVAGKAIMERCMQVMKKTETWRSLKEEEEKARMTRHFLFEILKTNEEIDNAWDAIAEMAAKTV